ncbi:SMODS domain-containing nucleotidyltransferase [Streptomyces tsukubensis]|uniref:Nucleotidyltransferase n=1 Tax=Streptomyces tsukubensis TaxID=83656 RepID=A0A1V4ACX1_9ACTN|nr:nucleotidyltransferase [Streptomyces tsukubensis]OON81610.1 nucleotidyltransferase [Streptomyces tsukubensis]QFR96382.1 nucleotidyltransferase [Streptomyces tsukubensis]
MQHVNCFTSFLRDVVNLSQAKLDLLSYRVEAIYQALKNDPELGPLILGKKPQGSWAQRTIINPVGDKEFDADFMLHLQEVLDWASNPATYIDKIYAALHRNSTYKGMPHTRKCRCVQLTYANSMHVDIVPYLCLADGREVIVNRDENRFEPTNPVGFTAWMKEKDDIAGGNLRKVIRLMKYLRDHRNSFTGTRSIILTTLLGERVTQATALLETGCYANVPTALLTIVEDLDEWLQGRPYKPSIPDPSQSGLTFDHRWNQATYAYFRDRIHTHAREIRAAYEETDPTTSLRLWRDLFGDRFPEPPEASSSSATPAAGPKFPVPPLITPTRTGRAG